MDWFCPGCFLWRTGDKCFVCYEPAPNFVTDLKNEQKERQEKQWYRLKMTGKKG